MIQRNKLDKTKNDYDFKCKLLDLGLLTREQQQSNKQVLSKIVGCDDTDRATVEYACDDF